jgi:SH3 domain protein
MKLTSIFLTLAAAVSMVTAYPITGEGVNCRSGPGTSYKVIKSYKKGTDVKISCQIKGESINGNNLWDKTQDGCYVSDYYVKTGSNSMVTKQCSSSGSGGSGSSGKSSYQGKITRDEIIERGMYWINKKVPYSQSAYYPDPQGRKYRTDCSGVSLSHA